LEEKVKRKSVWIGLCVLLVVLIASCKGGGSADLEGTWVSGTTVIVITASTLSAVDTVNGTWNCTIDNVDSAAGHMLLTQTAATGNYAMLPNGTPFYATYKLTGDTLLFESSNTGYPPTATTSFTRQ
jgi:hypothetical protein